MKAAGVNLRSYFPVVTPRVIERAMAAVAATGQDIAEATREAMTPGYFYETGLSQDETRYEQIEPLKGVVHIPTDYAAYPELGTVHMAPRPVLQPAIDQCWPSKLEEHAAEARSGMLPPAPAPHPMIDPISQAQRPAAARRRRSRP